MKYFMQMGLLLHGKNTGEFQEPWAKAVTHFGGCGCAFMITLVYIYEYVLCNLLWMWIDPAIIEHNTHSPSLSPLWMDTEFNFKNKQYRPNEHQFTPQDDPFTPVSSEKRYDSGVCTCVRACTFININVDCENVQMLLHCKHSIDFDWLGMVGHLVYRRVCRNIQNDRVLMLTCLHLKLFVHHNICA